VSPGVTSGDENEFEMPQEGGAQVQGEESGVKEKEKPMHMLAAMHWLK
jgi:hypothetical protein